MNAYTKAANWIKLMAGALANEENARDMELPGYVARCARAADFALAEAIKRFSNVDKAPEKRDDRGNR